MRLKLALKSRFGREEAVPNLVVGGMVEEPRSDGLIVACILASEDAVGAYNVDDRVIVGGLSTLQVIEAGGAGAGRAFRIISA